MVNTEGSLISQTFLFIFFQFTGQNNGRTAILVYFLVRKFNLLNRTWFTRTLTGVNMPFPTCMGAKTSKVQTHVALLLISHSVTWVLHNNSHLHIVQHEPFVFFVKQIRIMYWR